jgi:hypothetical protein
MAELTEDEKIAATPPTDESSDAPKKQVHDVQALKKASSQDSNPEETPKEEDEGDWSAYFVRPSRCTRDMWPYNKD